MKEHKNISKNKHSGIMCIIHTCGIKFRQLSADVMKEEKKFNLRNGLENMNWFFQVLFCLNTFLILSCDHRTNAPNKSFFYEFWPKYFNCVKMCGNRENSWLFTSKCTMSIVLLRPQSFFEDDIIELNFFFFQILAQKVFFSI